MNLILSLSLLPLLLATEATAQSASGAATPRQPTHGGAQDLAAPAPTGRTDTLLNGVSFDLSASEDESIASVQIGGYRSRLSVDGNANSQRGWNWSLKLAVPIGGHDDLTAGGAILGGHFRRLLSVRCAQRGPAQGGISECLQSRRRNDHLSSRRGQSGQ